MKLSEQLLACAAEARNAHDDFDGHQAGAADAFQTAATMAAREERAFEARVAEVVKSLREMALATYDQLGGGTATADIYREAIDEAADRVATQLGVK